MQHLTSTETGPSQDVRQKQLVAKIDQVLTLINNSLKIAVEGHHLALRYKNSENITKSQTAINALMKYSDAHKKMKENIINAQSMLIEEHYTTMLFELDNSMILTQHLQNTANEILIKPYQSYCIMQ